MNRLAHCACLIVLCAIPARGNEFPAFETVVIDSDAAQTAVYAVTVADVDTDGRPDIVAINERQVVWYKNPDWTKGILIEDQTERDNVCIAPHDIDQDGQIDFALGAGWTKVGTLQWISRGTRPEDRWSVHPIGVELSTHRMRWADVLGTGRPQLVVSPLNPSVAPGARLLAFSIPADPVRDSWPVAIIDESLHRMHNHWHVTLGGEPMLTFAAGQEGLFVYWHSDDGSFGRRRVGAGMPGTTPETSGAGEVKIGSLASGRPFMAAIEPMHGTSVSVYTGPDPLPEDQLADRLVIDDQLKGGHGLWTADLDGRSGDEIIVGHREPGTGASVGPGVYVYLAQDAGGQSWTKHVIDDGGMACEDLMCVDLTGDGAPDILAGGRATHNIKLYINRR